jgi:hypothetical protein
MKKLALKKRLVSLTFFATATLVSSLSLACFVATPEQTTPWQELVRRAKTVAFVEAVGAVPTTSESNPSTGGSSNDTVPAATATNAKFQVLAILKGPSSTTLEMDDVIALPKPDPKNADKSVDLQSQTFNDHHDKQFWRNGAGRTTPGPDCQIKPSFVVGQKYLVFQDKPYHVKSFEMIRNENDEWFAKVKAEIKKSGKNPVQ